jgi:hypothetical protein
VIGGTQTSLLDRRIVFKTTGLADADKPTANDTRSATGDGKIIE